MHKKIGYTLLCGLLGLTFGLVGGLTGWLAGMPPALAQSPGQSTATPGNTTAIAAAIMAQTAETTADTAIDGANLFETHCAACHARGGNIIRRGKTLKRKALTRNGYGEVSAIAALITQGKGAMPAYTDRLSAAEISAIAQYVHDRSESGW